MIRRAPETLRPRTVPVAPKCALHVERALAELANEASHAARLHRGHVDAALPIADVQNPEWRRHESILPFVCPAPQLHTCAGGAGGSTGGVCPPSISGRVYRPPR